MSDARTQVLARVRQALGRGTPSEPVPPEVPRAYRSAGEHAPGSAAVLDQLVDRLEDYRAHVHRVAPGGVADAVAQIVGHATTVVVPPGLDREWLAGLVTDPTSGRSHDAVRVVVDDPAAPLPAEMLDAASAVVTAARVAIAETGTIVLDGGPDQGRRAISLVPDVHLCVLRAGQVVQTVPEAVRALATSPARPLTWVSGPSATSDIELSRVEGVHGPRTLHVLLVEEAGAPGA
ncbi:lactate utilization protein C [Xylanimonas oleitrophica]|uniref:Lactate utilization protein C n=1 Tax=Xylanimonas oleitrophica TaxID=2607479 RepID=A0A2W5WN83_9MICO|nr:lactate utilization protein C [Xylanimonas oleitrophica]PZR52630.1 lactate utilization protein C [Xylanimonas oleitrophica]